MVSTEKVKSRNNLKNRKKSPNLILRLGFLFFILGGCFLILILHSSIEKEIWYFFNRLPKNTPVYIEYYDEAPKEDSAIVAADPYFSIVIPKIGVNAKIIQDVDPFNSWEYQQKLATGIAHASETALPDETGNSFYFAHSSDNFYNANRYNAVFYLLNKLENEDVFYIIFNKRKYTYKVIEAKFVSAEALEYISNNVDKQTATLMTCWPPGTDIKRLVVVGELYEL